LDGLVAAGAGVDGVDDAVTDGGDGGRPARPPLRVVDMGSGMAYLTFAVHAHLASRYALTTVGVEVRRQVLTARALSLSLSRTAP
jgi:hypothetical protein